MQVCLHSCSLINTYKCTLAKHSRFLRLQLLAEMHFQRRNVSVSTARHLLLSWTAFHCSRHRSLFLLVHIAKARSGKSSKCSRLTISSTYIPTAVISSILPASFLIGVRTRFHSLRRDTLLRQPQETFCMMIASLVTKDSNTIMSGSMADAHKATWSIQMYSTRDWLWPGSRVYCFSYSQESWANSRLIVHRSILDTLTRCWWSADNADLTGQLRRDTVSKCKKVSLRFVELLDRSISHRVFAAFDWYAGNGDSVLQFSCTN